MLVRLERRIDLLQPGESGEIFPRNGLALAAHGLGPAKLANSQRRGNVGQVVFESGGDNAIVPCVVAGINAFPGVSCESPCNDICNASARASQASSPVTAMPPSPVVIVLLA